MSEEQNEQWWPPLWIRIIDAVTGRIVCAIIGHKVQEEQVWTYPSGSASPSQVDGYNCTRCWKTFTGELPEVPSAK